MTSSQKIDPEKIKKILVIKLRHLGDVLLTTPLLYNLKEAFPGATIDTYVYEDTWPMLSGLPFIAKGLFYDKKWKKQRFKRFFYEGKLLLKIFKEKYDLVINLTEGDRGAIAALCSRAPIRVGIDPEGKGMRGKAGCFTHLVPKIHTIKHTVEMNLDSLRIIGIFPGTDQRRLHFHIPEEDRTRVDALLKENNIPSYILLHPVSRWMFKAWPADKVAALAHKIYEEEKMPLIFTSSPDPIEIDFNRAIIDKCSHIPHLDLSGKVTLKQLGYLIKRAKTLITVDSVSMHLSAVFHTPVVAIFGPTSEKRWAPWQHCAAKVVFKDLPCRPCYQPGCVGSYRSDCLETLEVQEVFKAYQSVKLCPKYDRLTSSFSINASTVPSAIKDPL